MAELKIHPSTVMAKVTVAFAGVLSLVILYLTTQADTNAWLAALVVPGLMLLIAIARIVAASFTVLEMAGDRIKFESGMLSKTTRSIPLHKVQDVTVNQSIGQRILNLGDLSIETAGETSRLTMPQIRDPRGVADRILQRASQFSPNLPPHRTS